MRLGVILFIVCILHNVSAQTFEQITELDNIEVRNVAAVHQDDYSFIWFAKDDGFFRYDGHHLRSIADLSDHKNLVGDKDVFRIRKDHEGVFWLCGSTGVLLSVDPSTYEVNSYTLPITKKLANNSSFDTASDENFIYIASETGMMILDRQSKEIEVLIPREHLVGDHPGDLNTMYCLFQDRFQKDKLWLLTRGGLLSYYKSTKKVYYHTKTLTDIYHYGTTALWDVRQDDEGRLWVGGGYYGAQYYDPAADSWTYFDDKAYSPHTENVNNQVQKTYEKSENEVWVFSRSSGFGYANLDKKKYTYFKRNPDSKQSILKGRYSKIFQDKDGAFWIGGTEGISYFNPKFQKIKKIELPFSKSYQSDIDESHAISWEQLDEKTVLVGTALADGIYLSDLNQQTIENISNIKLHNGKVVKIWDYLDQVLPAWEIIKLENGPVLVSIAGRIFEYDIRQKILKESNLPFLQEKSPPRPSKMIESKDGSLWMIDYFGDVVQIEVPSFKLKHRYRRSDIYKGDADIEGDYSVDLDEDSRGNIWLSTHFNIFKIKPENKTVTPFSSTYKEINDFVRSISEELVITKDDVMYIASETKGLLKVDLNDKNNHKFYTIKDGLPSERVYCVTEDGVKKVWVGTKNGLAVLNTENDKFSIIQKTHGIVENNLQHFWSADIEISKYDKVFFYSPEYFVYTDVEAFGNFSTPPIPLISAIEVLDNTAASNYSLHSQSEITLEYNENYFTAHLGTDSYTLSKSQKFEYILDGYDDKWHSTDNASVSYTKVPHGKYTFSVNAADFNGNWSTEPRKVQIEIIPPFWKTIWFRLICLFIFLAVAYAIYKWWLNNIQEKERMKSEFDRKLAQTEMDALRAQMNPHFLFNCLNSIKNYALTKGPFETADYLTKFSHLIRLILQNSKNSTVMLQDELEALKLYVEIEDLRFAERFEYEFKIDDDLEILSAHIPPMILQPYVENAIWHGLMHKQNGVGKLIVEIKNMGNVLQCTIEDNGIGRDKAMEIKKRKEGLRKKSLGMKITKNRIDLTNHLYNIDTKVNIVDLKNSNGEGVGTRIVIEIPLIDKHT